MLETPVLIVGGGPVGLALAAELGWRGTGCVLVERSDGRITTPKMNEVNVRTMEFCRRWGIADRVMRCPFPDDHPMDVAFVTKLSGHELARLVRPSRREQRPSPFSPEHLQICSQTWFDPILAEFARSHACVRLRHRSRLESFEVRGDRVRAKVVDVDTGAPETIEARFLAGCDGAASGIRRALDIDLAGSGILGRPVHMFFRTPDLFARLGARPGSFFLLVDRDGLWANLRIIDPATGLWRLMVLDSPAELDPEAIDANAYLRRALGCDVAVEWAGTSIWTRRGVVATRYSEGPVHLLGDAVHQLSPTGALGMNTGIADAVDLGWKLAATCDGWGGGHLLESYDAERRPVGERNVRVATGYFEGHREFERGLAAIEDTTAEGAAVRERVGEQLMRVARMFRTLGVQLGYQYDPSPICVPDGTPRPDDDPETYLPSARPGARAPHVLLADGRSSLDLFGRGFVLLRLGRDAPDPLGLTRAAIRRSVPIDVVTRSEPEMHERYGRRLVLVRPDGHVAWRDDAPPRDPDALIDRVRGAVRSGR